MKKALNQKTTFQLELERLQKERKQKAFKSKVELWTPIVGKIVFMIGMRIIKKRYPTLYTPLSLVTLGLRLMGNK